MSDFYNTWQAVGKAVGIETTYTDNWGKIHLTDPRTATRILETKGIHISEDRTQVNPQVLVVSAGDLPDNVDIFFHTRLNPSQLEKATGSLTFTEANQRLPESRYVVCQNGLPAKIDPKTGLLAVALPFPRDLTVGLYQFNVEGFINEEQMSAVCLWLVCPANAYLPPAMVNGRRIAGVGLALYGVRSQNNWGHRRFLRSEAADRLGSGGFERGFYRAQPLARLVQQETVQ